MHSITRSKPSRAARARHSPKTSVHHGDLDSLLPSDISDRQIKVSIKGDQLFVYLSDPFKGQGDTWFPIKRAGVRFADMPEAKNFQIHP